MQPLRFIVREYSLHRFMMQEMKTRVEINLKPPFVPVESVVPSERLNSPEYRTDTMSSALDISSKQAPRDKERPLG